MEITEKDVQILKEYLDLLKEILRAKQEMQAIGRLPVVVPYPMPYPVYTEPYRPPWEIWYTVSATT